MPQPPSAARPSRFVAFFGSRPMASATASRRFLLAAQVACFLLFALAVSHLVKKQTGMTSTIMFGSQFESGRLESVKHMQGRAVEEDSLGYDGQFYKAHSWPSIPLLTDPHLRRGHRQRGVSQPPDLVLLDRVASGTWPDQLGDPRVCRSKRSVLDCDRDLAAALAAAHELVQFRSLGGNPLLVRSRPQPHARADGRAGTVCAAAGNLPMRSGLGGLGPASAFSGSPPSARRRPCWPGWERSRRRPGSRLDSRIYGSSPERSRRKGSFWCCRWPCG